MRQPDLRQAGREFYYDQLYLSNYATLERQGRPGARQGRRRRDLPRPARLQHAGLARPAASWRRCGMTAGDVIKAIREQNVQVAAGRLGQPPVPAGTNRAVPTRRSTPRAASSSEEQFDNIIVKTGSKGEVVKLRDVVRKVKRDEHGRDRREGHRTGRQELRRQQLPRRRSVGHPGRVPVARLERPEDGRRRSRRRWRS